MFNLDLPIGHRWDSGLPVIDNYFQIWTEYFDLGALREGLQQRFAFFAKTDGYSISLLMHKSAGDVIDDDFEDMEIEPLARFQGATDYEDEWDESDFFLPDKQYKIDGMNPDVFERLGNNEYSAGIIGVDLGAHNVYASVRRIGDSEITGVLTSDHYQKMIKQKAFKIRHDKISKHYLQFDATVRRAFKLVGNKNLIKTIFWNQK